MRIHVACACLLAACAMTATARAGCRGVQVGTICDTYRVPHYDPYGDMELGAALDQGTIDGDDLSAGERAMGVDPGTARMDGDALTGSESGEALDELDR